MDGPAWKRGFLAVDAGQTGVRVRARSTTQGPLEMELAGVRTDIPLAPQLVAVVDSVFQQTRIRFDTVAVATTGLTGAEADADALLNRVHYLGITRVFLAHDSVSSFLGALGDRRGVVIAAGTGSIITAMGRDHVARVDGWGHIMGDAGSGYWIGREGLRAAMRAHDGRGPETALLSLVRASWANVEDAYIALQSDPEWVRAVAAFSQDVAALAREDAEAARICQEAGDHLAASALAGLARVHEPSESGGNTAVALLGNVFRSALIRAQVTQSITGAVPGAVVVKPAGTGLDGVDLFAELPQTHPLRGLISDAST